MYWELTPLMGEQNPANIPPHGTSMGQVLRLLFEGRHCSLRLLPLKSTSAMFGRDQPLLKLQEQNKS